VKVLAGVHQPGNRHDDFRRPASVARRTERCADSASQQCSRTWRSARIWMSS
jgi:hypothetical protein